jgi:NAD(P)-dependent dehydrogenase (short-subunit alcohol dehydrogenase family)
VEFQTTPLPLGGGVALVTGGGRGVGRVLAQALAGAGAAVGVVARSADELTNTVRLIQAQGGVAAAVTADVADPAAAHNAFARLRDELGPVDLLVNNAGITGPMGPAWEVNEGEWWRTLEVNLHATNLCSRLVLPDMVARRQGRIVNITSRAGVYRWPLFSAYSVSKAAVIKYTENLAQEAKRYGIGVFSLHPGILTIGFGEQAATAIAQGGDAYDGLAKWFRGELAAGRSAQPHQAADLLISIALGKADKLSGRHLTVDDDIDSIVAQIDEVHTDDDYLLRVRTLTTPQHRASATARDNDNS